VEWGELQNCRSVLVNCCCEKLVAEARGQFGEPGGRRAFAVESRYQATTGKGTAGREDLCVCCSELQNM
jgi:hypothetical protein